MSKFVCLVLSPSDPEVLILRVYHLIFLFFYFILIVLHQFPSFFGLGTSCEQNI